MVSLLIANGSKLNEDEACRHTDLGEVSYQHSFLQANESNEWFCQTLHFTYQNI